MTDSNNNQNFTSKSHNSVITLVNKSLEDMEKGEEVSATLQNRATAILIVISLIMFLTFIVAIFWHDLL